MRTRCSSVVTMLKVLAALLVASVLLVLSPSSASAEPGDPDPTDDALGQTIDADQEVAEDDAVRDAGHVDLGPRYEDGAWTLMIHDDTSVDGSVWRRLENTVIRVDDDAVQQVPDDPTYSFLGVDPGADVHVVPQTQNPDVVWLGWNTQDPQVMETVDRGVTLSLEGIEGPGRLVVYLQDGGFGDPDVLWDSEQDGDQPLWVDVNTHTHANWVFSEPGVYLVRIAATAATVTGGEETTTGTLRVAVGDATDPQDALDAEESAASSSTSAEDVTADPADSAEESGDANGTAGWWWALGGATIVLVLLLAGVTVRSRRVRDRALRDDSGEDA